MGAQLGVATGGPRAQPLATSRRYGLRQGPRARTVELTAAGCAEMRTMSPIRNVDPVKAALLAAVVCAVLLGLHTGPARPTRNTPHPTPAEAYSSRAAA